MSTSPKEPSISMDAQQPRDVWQRWVPFWYSIFYLMLVFSLFRSQSEWLHSARLAVALFSLCIVLGGWYWLHIGPLAAYLEQHQWAWAIYLVVEWGLWLELTLLDPTFLFVLFGLYPQVFLLHSTPWMITYALALTALSFWRQMLLLQAVDDSTLVIMGATIFSICIALFIDAIIRQSRYRRLLIHELEKTRQELATAERQAGVIEERQRLAHEIHDTLVQGFTSVVMNLEAAEGALPSDMLTLQRHLNQARGTARENLIEARRLLWALQPEAFDHACLPEVLSNLASDWAQKNDVRVSTTVTGTSCTLRPEIEVTLLRASQELLANAGKYAAAHQLNLTLSYMDDEVILDIQDDGQGFDPAQLLTTAPGRVTNGFGLRALHERAQQLGGTVSVESAAQEGTTISVALPMVRGA